MITLSRTDIRSDMRAALSDALEQENSWNITIESNVLNSYDDLKLAISEKINIILPNADLIKYDTPFYKKLAALYAIRQSERNLAGAVDALVKCVPSKITEDKALEFAASHACAAVFVPAFKAALKARNKKVRSYIRAVSRNPLVSRMSVKYSSKHARKVSRNGAINIFDGEMGTGKTIHGLLPAFHAACEDGRTPILVNSSRALSGTYLRAGDTRHYKEAAKHGMQRGLVGVCNTVLMRDEFEKYRESAKLYLVDEYESLCDHSVGDAVEDGSIEARAALYSANLRMIEIAHTVMLADAYFSTFSLDELIEIAEKTGRKIIIWKMKSSHAKPTVRVMKLNNNIKALADHIADGNKAGMFCDAKHNKTGSTFNKRVSSISRKATGPVAQIDAGFMSSDRASELSFPSEFAAKHSIIAYNSAAATGLSFLDPDYDTVSILASGTVGPLSLLQSPGRFRLASLILLSFAVAMRRECSTNPEKVLAEILLSERSDKEYSVRELTLMIQDERFMRVARRIAHKNKMHSDYKNNVLIMLEELGYSVEFDDVERTDEENEEAARLVKAGEGSEEKRRIKSVINAEIVSREKATKIRKSEEAESAENKAVLESFDLRDFYSQPQITEELMEFDAEGKGRRYIKNLKIARNTYSVDKGADSIKRVMIQKFFELTKLKINGDCTFTKADIAPFLYFVQTGEVSINQITRSAKEAFEIAFRDVKITDLCGTRLAKSILRTGFGIKAEKTKSKHKRNWIYKVEKNEDLEKWYAAAASPRLTNIKAAA